MPMGVPCLIICAIAAGARASFYLMEGCGTAGARMSGYQHATNFATAFRRRVAARRRAALTPVSDGVPTLCA